MEKGCFDWETFLFLFLFWFRFFALLAQSVERIHGKDEVTSSNLVEGSYSGKGQGVQLKKLGCLSTKRLRQSGICVRNPENGYRLVVQRLE